MNRTRKLPRVFIHNNFFVVFPYHTFKKLFSTSMGKSSVEGNAGITDHTPASITMDPDSRRTILAFYSSLESGILLQFIP